MVLLGMFRAVEILGGPAHVQAHEAHENATSEQQNQHAQAPPELYFKEIILGSECTYYSDARLLRQSKTQECFSNVNRLQCELARSEVDALVICTNPCKDPYTTKG